MQRTDKFLIPALFCGPGKPSRVRVMYFCSPIPHLPSLSPLFSGSFCSNVFFLPATFFFFISNEGLAQARKYRRFFMLSECMRSNVPYSQGNVGFCLLFPAWFLQWQYLSSSDLFFLFSLLFPPAELVL